jgi:hypothetical protein
VALQFVPSYSRKDNPTALIFECSLVECKRFSDPTLMLARAMRQTSRLFGGKVSHI